MRAKITNHSQFPRYYWSNVGVPYGSLSDPEMIFRTDDNLRLKAIRTFDLGTHTTFYRVLAPLDGNESISGTFVEGGIEPETKFTVTDWMSDGGVEDILVKWVVRINGQDYRLSLSDTTVEKIDESPAHQRYVTRGRLEGAASGLVSEIQTTFLTGQDVAEIKGRLTFSDRNSDSLAFSVEAIAIECDEPIVIYHATRNQHHGPIIGGETTTWLYSGPLTFDDGQGVEFEGALLAVPDGPLPQPVAEETEPREDSEEEYNRDLALSRRVNNLLAAYEGPVTASAIDGAWDGNWMGNLWIPRVQQGNPIPSSFEFFLGISAQPAPVNLGRPPAAIYHQRHLGNVYDTGRTGDQEDFGATGGTTAVSLEDPRYIFEAAHANQACAFRGFLHFEDDCSILKFEDHPGWRVWSGRTHFRIHPDTLGKRQPIWGDLRASGHTGWDDQHRSWNNWMAYLALTGDYLTVQALKHHIELDLAMVPNRTGAPRAIGRLLLAWSHAYRMLDDEYKLKLKKVVKDKVDTLVAQWPGGRHNNPVKVIGYGTDPRMKVTDPNNGNPLPAWVVWEHGLAAVGLYAAMKTFGFEEIRPVLEGVCRTIVDHAYYREGENWRVTANVWYPGAGTADEGKPIDPTLYHSSSTYINNGPIEVWTTPALLIMNELHKDHDEFKEKMLSIIRNRVGFEEFRDTYSAKWFAAVKSIVQS